MLCPKYSFADLHAGNRFRTDTPPGAAGGNTRVISNSCEKSSFPV